MTITEIRQRQERFGTAAEWTTANTVLLMAEIGIESDTRLKKIGDGATPWNSLDYEPVDHTQVIGLTAAIVAASPYGARGLFAKADPLSVGFTVTGVGTISIKAGTYLDVDGTLVSFTGATVVTMPALTAGTDYFIYCTTTGALSAVAATGIWPTAVAAPPANSRLIGGFHYAPGGNATARAGGNTTPAINEFSMWDLKFLPAADDPRGMTLVAGQFWTDIYLTNRDPQTFGTSRNNQPIADGETASTTTAIIPTAFGGNGSTRYVTGNWWSAAEALAAFAKRLPTYSEFAALAFGSTEVVSRGNDPITTGLGTTNAGSSNADEKFTSKWGVIQASGVEWAWGGNFGGGAAAASWSANTESRGSTYQMENAAIFGGYWLDSAYSGSRASVWIYSPTSSSDFLGARGVCDHLRLA